MSRIRLNCSASSITLLCITESTADAGGCIFSNNFSSYFLFLLTALCTEYRLVVCSVAALCAVCYSHVKARMP